MLYKKIFVTVILLIGISIEVLPQNGTILMDTLNLKVVKVWGNHQQRGYAYGYLCGAGMSQIINNYVKPVLGNQYNTARNIIITGNDLEIDSRFQDEAQGIINGMNAAGTNLSGLDATDVMVGNCLLDLMGLLGMKSEMGCSSLMDWGDATLGTSLNGKSVVARHLDWQSNSYILNNQVLLIQQPSEADEQNWAMIGFEGMFGALSGINNHMAAFQHVMDDYNGVGSQHNLHYKPVWLAMRQALERSDYNQDGFCNVQDVTAALSESVNGFADAYIVSALAENNSVDSLVALIAEIAPQNPTHSYRYSTLPDSIPGDNLYAANYQIGRNNAMHFCPRYNGIRSHIGDGTNIDLSTNWELMRDYSHQSNNVQFIQYSPEMHHLQLSVRLGQAAYLCDSLVFNSDLLLNTVVTVPEFNKNPIVKIFPNPSETGLYIEISPGSAQLLTLEVYDITGKLLYDKEWKATVTDTVFIPTEHWKKGTYILRMISGNNTQVTRFIKK